MIRSHKMNICVCSIFFSFGHELHEKINLRGNIVAHTQLLASHAHKRKKNVPKNKLKQINLNALFTQTDSISPSASSSSYFFK